MRWMVHIHVLCNQEGHTRTCFFLTRHSRAANRIASLAISFRLQHSSSSETFATSKMPKITLSSLPISSLFAVAKPSGPTSMSVVNDIKKLVGGSRLFVEVEKLDKRKGSHRHKGKRAREAVKIGQGGTLDPLADGVLVIGVGRGTKRLNEFLDRSRQWDALPGVIVQRHSVHFESRKASQNHQSLEIDR